MKKILMFTIIIIMIIVSVSLYIKHTKKNNYNIENEIILNSEGDFLLYIDDIQDNNGYLEVAGIISQGTIDVDNEISIVGLGLKERNSKVIKLEFNNIEVKSAKAGDNVCITLDSNIKKEHITKGQSIITPGSTKPIFNIDAQIVSDLSLKQIKEEANNFYINTDIKCSVTIISEGEKKIKIKLEKPIVVAGELEGLLKNEDRVIAKCKVNK